ncbi:MAG: CvpA family protein [Gemmataceae bacterium]|nr:CvpA family protein [Gemmataceae bacterium]MCI0737754.1 CvpA family protein [Gemmataceae bacterium]
MHWLDTIILVLLALGAVLGFWSGFLWQIARVLSLVLALVVTILFHVPATRYLQEHVLRGADERVVEVAAYIALFVLVYLVLFFATRLAHTGIRATELQIFDRLLGCMLGFSKMALVIGGVCLAAANYPHETTKDLLGKSSLAPLFAHGMEHVLVVIPEDQKENLRATLLGLRDLLARPDKEET